MKVLQEAEVFETMKVILGQVAPEKAQKGFTPETSLINDLGLDDGEIFNMMELMQNEFFKENPGKIDADKFDYTFKVGEICKVIVNSSKG